jgi:hypothetical protein
MSSRNMCLLPRATLHSDSEQLESSELKAQKLLKRKEASGESVFNINFASDSA